ncbi:MAG: PorT family protein [Bacteroidales bacterium]|nr:PorT family protein [Bacteroidales bacterium]
MIRNTRLLIAAVLIALSFSGFGQNPKNLPRYDQQKFHFGFTLGFNSMDFRVTPVERSNNISDTVMLLEPVPQPGFNIGIVSSMKLDKYLDLRFVPTLSFGERKLKYKLRFSDSTIVSDEKVVESTYIDFPIFIKYKSKRLHNTRAYVTAGGRYSLDLASQSDKQNSTDAPIKLTPHDASVELGVGFDFYLNYFKFGTELKMAYGVLNLLKEEENLYAQGVKSLNSKMFWLTFTFE